MQDRKKEQMLEKAMPFRRRFSESGFRQKLRQVAQYGRRPLELSMTLYYAFRDPATPVWCKTVIIGVLGYFISVIDAIPDLTPVLGYTDDIGMMVAALSVLGSHIRPEHRSKAQAKVSSVLAGDEPAMDINGAADGADAGGDAGEKGV